MFTSINRLQDIWNNWSKNLFNFEYIAENSYLVKTKFLSKKQKLISFYLFFDLDTGTYSLEYEKEKKPLKIDNIKEENLPTEILNFALKISKL